MIIPKVPDAIILYFVLCVYSVMSLEETINKLIKAVENSSNAETPLEGPVTYPWDGKLFPKGCVCIEYISDGLPELGDPIHCIAMKCEPGVVYTRESTSPEIGYIWRRAQTQTGLYLRRRS